MRHFKGFSFYALEFLYVSVWNPEFASAVKLNALFLNLSCFMFAHSLVNGETI